MPTGFSLMQPPPPAQYAGFIKNAERQHGLVDIIRKDDEVYFDLGPDQLNHPLIVAPVLASGVGMDAFGGRVFPSFMLEFQRVGKRILWVEKNTDFAAPPNSPAADSLAVSIADSIVNSTPIVAEDEAKQRIVIPATLFLTDFENLGHDLGAPQQPVLLLSLSPRPGYIVDPTRSYFEKTKAFPLNDELEASLAFVGPPGTSAPGGAPDARGVRLRMHYSIVEPPSSSSYIPRLADDRIGYFITAQKRFDDDTRPTPFVRYIARWNFKNGPIVYYLTDEIPVRYKPPIRAALMEWNRAFAKAGIPNAIEVRDQPSDPSWDPDDARYSTVRWITNDRGGFAAYGPHVADPRTGEILRVEIVIDGEAMRSIKRGYVEQVLPVRAEPTAAGCSDLDECDNFLQDSAEFAATGSLALQLGGTSSAATEKFAEDWLQSVVLHESGHNFGLRHNFAAAIYPLHDLHDRNFTRTHGLVSSVMHYTPLNLSPPGQPQGDYFQLRLGPYDYWAIQYGYTTFPNVARPEDEAVALHRIADESSRPELTYASDEDASGPRAIDPHVATFLLSSDPFAFYDNQFAVVDDLVGRLDRVYPRDDRPYVDERNAFLSTMRTYLRAAMLSTRYIGGLYTSRTHRGQPGGVPPFRAIARADQRHAFAILAAHVFSSRAMRLSPGLLNDLGPDNYVHHGADDVLERPDFPVSDFIAGMQDEVMYELFSPDAMSRIADEQLKSKPGTSMSLDDLFGWMQAAVWDDLVAGTRSIDPQHRALQRRYTTLLIEFALAPSVVVEDIGFPGDSPSLARFELERLDARLANVLRSPRLDTATRAHLDDIHNRVAHALEPSAVRGS